DRDEFRRQICRPPRGRAGAVRTRGEQGPGVAEDLRGCKGASAVQGARKEKVGPAASCPAQCQSASSPTSTSSRWRRDTSRPAKPVSVPRLNCSSGSFRSEERRVGKECIYRSSL